MKNFMKLFAVLVVTVLILTMMQPGRYQVKKIITINASNADVYDVISDLKTWPEWSPWFEEDQSIQVTFSDSPAEIGGFSEWKSNSFGEGRQTIADLERNHSVKLDIEFFNPLPQKTKTQFLLVDITEKETQVTCVVYGENESLLDKFLFLVRGFEKRMNEDYERALQNIKTIAEERSN